MGLTRGVLVAIRAVKHSRSPRVFDGFSVLGRRGGPRAVAFFGMKSFILSDGSHVQFGVE